MQGGIITISEKAKLYEYLNHDMFASMSGAKVFLKDDLLKVIRSGDGLVLTNEKIILPSRLAIQVIEEKSIIILKTINFRQAITWDRSTSFNLFSFASLNPYSIEQGQVTFMLVQFLSNNEIEITGSYKCLQDVIDYLSIYISDTNLSK